MEDTNTQTMNRLTVSRKLDSYFENENRMDAPSLLRAVQKAMTEIKKEQPHLIGLTVSDLSFLSDEKGGLTLKVYFEEDV